MFNLRNLTFRKAILKTGYYLVGLESHSSLNIVQSIFFLFSSRLNLVPHHDVKNVQYFISKSIKVGFPSKKKNGA